MPFRCLFQLVVSRWCYFRNSNLWTTGILHPTTSWMHQETLEKSPAVSNLIMQMQPLSVLCSWTIMKSVAIKETQGFRTASQYLAKSYRVNSRRASQQPFTTWRTNYSRPFILGFYLQSEPVRGFCIIVPLCWTSTLTQPCSSLWWCWCLSNISRPVAAHCSFSLASSDMVHNSHRKFSSHLSIQMALEWL